MATESKGCSLDPPCLVPLITGGHFVVSSIDHEWAKGMKWLKDTGGYAVATTGDLRKQKAHRLVVERMGIDLGELVVDHIENDRLDNRRSMLRAVTQRTNAQNRSGKKSKANTTGHTGVSRSHGKFCATLGRDYGQRVGPERATVEEAVADRERFVKEYEEEKAARIRQVQAEKEAKVAAATYRRELEACARCT